MIPSWLRKYLSNEGLKKIEKKVAQIELSTSGEIVPMIVRRSSTVGHVPIMIYSLGLLLYYIFGIPDLQAEYFEGAWWFILVWSLLLIPITHWLSQRSIIQRNLVSRIDRESQSSDRALNEFYQANLHKTDGSTGILLFISLVDHQVVVLGDDSINEKIDPKMWSETVDLLLKGIHSKDMAEGICMALDKCGEVLKIHFPIQAGDENELPNHLVIKD